MKPCTRCGHPTPDFEAWQYGDEWLCQDCWEIVCDIDWWAAMQSLEVAA